MLPEMLLIRQNRQAAAPLADIPSTLNESLRSIAFDPAELHGKTVGIAVGSRGIDQIPAVVRAVVDVIRNAGGIPEVFAAMGCHGDGTADGQREMLASLGICEETVGAPIRTCAETVPYGTTTSGIPVYGNTLPLRYDAVILINRVKMHTDFEDFTESGLLKLLAIGVGNPTGCMNVHTHALRYGYGPVIRETAAVMLEKLPVVFGVMLTENWKHELDHLEAVRPAAFVDRETLLLQQVKQQASRLPVDRADVLIVGEIGKDVSGTGMDTKTIGRIGIMGQKEPEKPTIQRVVVLDLTDASHGNAIGIGLADLAPMSVHDKINIHATSLNAVSSMSPEQGRLPCFLSCDQDTLEAAAATAAIADPEQAHIIYIQNTNLMEYMAVSRALYEDMLQGDPQIEVVGNPFHFTFDEQGILLQRWNEGRLMNL